MYNSHGTYTFSMQVCNSLLAYFQDTKLDLINKSLIYEFISYCNNKGLSNNTINKRLSMLKRLYKFSDVPCLFSDVKNLKEKFITYGALDNNTLKAVYSILPKLSLYNQCMMLVFIECGVRVNELIHIKTKNVNLNNRCIFLEYTKTNKPRYVFLSASTCELLKVFINANKNCDHVYLFPAKKSNSMLSRYTVNSIFSRIRKKYNFNKLSPHMLRHTLSTKLYNNGANLLFICSLMGHSNPNTTKRYVHNDLTNDLKMFDTYFK